MTFLMLQVDDAARERVLGERDLPPAQRDGREVYVWSSPATLPLAFRPSEATYLGNAF